MVENKPNEMDNVDTAIRLAVRKYGPVVVALSLSSHVQQILMSALEFARAAVSADETRQ